MFDLFGSASRCTTQTGKSSTTNMRLTLVTSACCRGKEDEEGKKTVANKLEMQIGYVGNESLCKTTSEFFTGKYVALTRDLLYSQEPACMQQILRIDAALMLLPQKRWEMLNTN